MQVFLTQKADKKKCAGFGAWRESKVQKIVSVPNYDPTPWSDIGQQKGLKEGSQFWRHSPFPVHEKTPAEFLQKVHQRIDNDPALRN